MGNVTNFNLKNFYNILTNEGSLLYTYQFVTEFNGLDDAWGITDSTDASGNITYYLQSSDVPGVTLTTTKTQFLGTEFRMPGVKTFGHNWSVQCILTQDLKIYKGFRKWQDNISDLSHDGGGDKAIPNVNARVCILDPTSKFKTTSFVLEGIWIKKVGDISLKYEQGGGAPITQFPIEFRYQYCYKDDGFNGDADPLKA